MSGKRGILHRSTIQFSGWERLCTRESYSTVEYSPDTVTFSVLHKPLNDESACAAHLNIPG